MSPESQFHKGDIIAINSNLKPEYADCVVVSNNEEEATYKQLNKYDGTESCFSPQTLDTLTLNSLEALNIGVIGTYC